MSDMPERIYANDANHWHPFPGEEGTAEYVRADLYAALQLKLKEAELRAEYERASGIIEGQGFPPPADIIQIHPYGTQFLEKALVQAIACGGLALPTNQEAVSHGLVCTMDDGDRLMCAVELNSYLQEVRE